MIGILASAIAVEEKRLCAEVELEERDALFRSRYEAISAGILVYDTNGIITHANKAASDILGLPHDYLQGKPGLDPTWRSVREDGSPLPEEERPSRIILRTKQPVRNVVVGFHTSRSNGLRWLLVDAQPIFDSDTGELKEILSTFRDITKRKLVEEEVELLSRRNAAILNSAGEGIYGVDAKGDVTFVNPAAARMLGYKIGELIGSHAHTLMHYAREDGTSYPKSECGVYAAAEDRTTHHISNEVFWRKDGTSFPIDYVSTPIWEHGKLAGSVVVFTDITQRRQAERQLRDRTSELEAVFHAFHDLYFWLDKDGTILDYHAERRDLYKPPEEFLGKRMQDVLPQEAGSKFEWALSRMGETDSPVQIEYEIPWYGEGHTFEARLSLLSDGRVIVIVRDITERKKSEEEIQHLAAIVETSDDAIFSKDLNGVVTHVEPRSGNHLRLCEGGNRRARHQNISAGPSLGDRLDTGEDRARGKHRPLRHYANQERWQENRCLADHISDKGFGGRDRGRVRYCSRHHGARARRRFAAVKRGPLTDATSTQPDDGSIAAGDYGFRS